MVKWIFKQIDEEFNNLKTEVYDINNHDSTSFEDVLPSDRSHHANQITYTSPVKLLSENNSVKGNTTDVYTHNANDAYNYSSIRSPVIGSKDYTSPDPNSGGKQAKRRNMRNSVDNRGNRNIKWHPQTSLVPKQVDMLFNGKDANGNYMTPYQEYFEIIVNLKN